MLDFVSNYWHFFIIIFLVLLSALQRLQFLLMKEQNRELFEENVALKIAAAKNDLNLQEQLLNQKEKLLNDLSAGTTFRTSFFKVCSSILEKGKSRFR